MCRHIRCCKVGTKFPWVIANARGQKSWCLFLKSGWKWKNIWNHHLYIVIHSWTKTQVYEFSFLNMSCTKSLFLDTWDLDFVNKARFRIADFCRNLQPLLVITENVDKTQALEFASFREGRTKRAIKRYPYPTNYIESWISQVPIFFRLTTLSPFFGKSRVTPGVCDRFLEHGFIFPVWGTLYIKDLKLEITLKYNRLQRPSLKLIAKAAGKMVGRWSGFLLGLSRA